MVLCAAGKPRVNWDAIGAIGEIIGAVAVFATLVYLSLQIRHNSAMTKASIRQARVGWSLQWADAFANSDHLPRILVKLQSAEELTPEEDVRWTTFKIAWHRNLEAALIQQADGLLDSEVLEGQRQHLIDDSAQVSVLHNWDSFKANFDPRYQSFVDDAIKQWSQNKERNVGA